MTHAPVVEQSTVELPTVITRETVKVVVKLPSGALEATVAPTIEHLLAVVAPASHSPTAIWVIGAKPVPLTVTICPSVNPVAGCTVTAGSLEAAGEPASAAARLLAPNGASVNATTPTTVPSSPTHGRNGRDAGERLTAHAVGSCTPRTWTDDPAGSPITSRRLETGVCTLDGV